MKRSLNILSILAVLALAAAPGLAEVKLHPIFADHMVLQQNKDLSVYGTAAPDEKVEVTFQTKTASAAADKNGDWKVAIGQFKAGGPFELTVKGNNTITLKDVLVGEVWVCSGQSNMAFATWQSNNGQQEVAAADYPQIRLLFVDNTVSVSPQKDFTGRWEVCSPKTVGGFSAVGYFFGRDLYKALKVPVGLIHTNWGGTPAEAWTSADGLKDPLLTHYRQRAEDFAKRAPEILDNYFKAVDAYKAKLQKSLADGKGVPTGIPELPGELRDAGMPCSLYNGMISPLVGFPVAGATWYQGEANADRAKEYQTLLPAMIQDWRTHWQDPKMTFLIVQLANFMQPNPQPEDTGWARLREAQTLTAANVAKTGLGLAIDIGDAADIHPRNKQDVGHRLALAALAIEYGKEIEFSGPMYKSMKVDGDKAVLEFTHVGGGLVAKTTDVKDAPLADSPLKRFEVAGEDKKFHWATARIDGDKVIVTCPDVPHPVAVRYAWANNPTGCNLYNKADLPAVPFRTDDWPQ
jgi:sialate O-acetylesterase